ncbi:MAG: ribosome assembly cofactor RimP, partial [Bacteroidota bacterium]|nr:ribosome assembly cofactor RimP [Bacteroidota bacterium]MDX5431642.1 ribosome assembly cofactor RimP [Bacteroidota bacterium]MDX5470360.1 ribosome assembly cofactor RimP [Bacteroidota bacterium]
MDLAAQIKQFAEEAIEDPQYFVVEVITENNGRMIKVLLDGDEGIPIAVCSQVSRRVSVRVDEEIPDEVGAFTIEVSSPGVDRPLKMERQYAKHFGRSLAFIDENGVRKEGKLVGLNEGTLQIEETIKEKGKKAQQVLNAYKVEQISDPKVVVSFK